MGSGHSLRGRLGCRQQDLERGAPIGVVDGQRSAGLPDDPVADGETEAGSLVGSFRGEERIEDMIDHLRGNPACLVLDA